MEFEQAESQVSDQAERMAETQILDAIDENLPEGAEEEDWNWGNCEATASVLPLPRPVGLSVSRTTVSYVWLITALPRFASGTQRATTASVRRIPS